MRKYIYIIVSTLLMVLSCTDIRNINPYESQLYPLSVQAVYPDDYSDYSLEGLSVLMEEMTTGNIYTLSTDATGAINTSLPCGLYRIAVTGIFDQDIFNAMADRVVLSGEGTSLTLHMTHSRSGKLVIKEIYSGGCLKLPHEGTYQSDKYFIIHNNHDEIQYLDGLCFGMLSPYNSTSSNPWISSDPVTGETIYPDFLPMLQVIWQFGGDGATFPLRPGEDAVVCVNGAIDHSAQYPLSVNLNKPEYFVCYNETYFNNTLYHPAPGDRISQERYLDVVVNMGQANAFALSISSPTLVLFRAEGMTIQEHIDNVGITPVPGSSVDNVVKIPYEWVIDAVEVFDSRSTNNHKRIPPVLDAGYSLQTDTYLGRSHIRRTNEGVSMAKGYEVLVDTNNSLTDFYESSIQSLHE